MLSLFVQVLPQGFRIALCRADRLLRFSFLPSEPPPVGSLFCARVVDPKPDLNLAFLELGDGLRGVLNVRDLPKALRDQGLDTAGRLLKPNQIIPVQIRKQAYGDKLAGLTAKISWPGFNLVYLPFEPGMRFSKRFSGDKQPIQRALAQFGEGGWIVRRTAGERAEEKLIAEAKRLLEKHQLHFEKAQEGKSRLVYQTPVLQSLLVEYAGSEFRSIIVDDVNVYDDLKSFLKEDCPAWLSALKLHQEETPIFDTYRLESRVEEALAEKVYLKTGGSLRIQNTEAMTVIDVNSGKNTKRKSGSDPSVITNREAVEEIARQILLRNIGGLIVIDLVDAPRGKEAESLLQKMTELLRAEGGEVRCLDIDEFGLLRISRRRNGPSLDEQLKTECRTCRGSGMQADWSLLETQIQIALLRQAAGLSDEVLEVHAAPGLAGYLRNRKNRLLVPLLADRNLGLEIVEREDFVSPQFEIQYL